MIERLTFNSAAPRKGGGLTELVKCFLIIIIQYGGGKILPMSGFYIKPKKPSSIVIGAKYYLKLKTL